MNKQNIIDVWDVSSFDKNLLNALRAGSDLVVNYQRRRKECFDIYESSKKFGPVIDRPKNKYANDYVIFRDSFIGLMAKRTIRGWHYTRLTDDEVLKIGQSGISPSTIAHLRERLDNQVCVGNLTTTQADYIFDRSPLHNPLVVRENMFWLVATPASVEETGIKPLVTFWGGEVANFCLDEAECASIVSFGRGRVLECAIPIASTDYGATAAASVVNAFALSLGTKPDNTPGFDFNIKYSLAPEAILRVHSEGDESYHTLGQNLQQKFIK